MAAQAKLEAFRPYAESNKYIQLDVRDPSIRLRYCFALWWRASNA